MSITERQQEILKDVLDGFSDEEIARKRYIEPSTVKSHVVALFKAYKVNTRAKLIATIYKNKINKIREVIGE